MLAQISDRISAEPIGYRLAFAITVLYKCIC